MGNMPWVLPRGVPHPSSPPAFHILAPAIGSQNSNDGVAGAWVVAMHSAEAVAVRKRDAAGCPSCFPLISTKNQCWDGGLPAFLWQKEEVTSHPHSCSSEPPSIAPALRTVTAEDAELATYTSAVQSGETAARLAGVLERPTPLLF